MALAFLAFEKLHRPLKLGRLIERHMKIEDAFGRLSRHSPIRAIGSVSPIAQQQQDVESVTYVLRRFCYLSPRPVTSGI